MKKYFILISFLVAVSAIGFSQDFTSSNVSANSQDFSPSNYTDLANRLQKSNKNLVDPKKKDLAKTWLERAKLFEEIGDVNTMFLRMSPPMGVTDVKLILKDPKEITKTAVMDGNTVHNIDQYVYDYFTLNVENNIVKSWVETKFIVPDALDSAVKCYQKAIDLDIENKLTKKIKEGLKSITLIYQKDALNFYTLKNYKDAFHAFKNIMDINDLKQVNYVDTTVTFYTGVIANQAGLRDEALKYYLREKDLNYGKKEPTIYYSISSIYLTKKDSADALAVLQEGFKAYPSNSLILEQLINFYMSSGESQLALNYLSTAINSDPSNKSYYFAQGTLYDKLDSFDRGVASYNKVIQIDTNYFDAYFNLGAIYANHAREIQNKAQDEKDNKKYEEEKGIAEGEFAKSIPYFVKAHEIKPKDKQTLDNLKAIYHRLKMDDKYNEVLKLLEQLKQ
jgi:tetratricopeptide (TPR) repeat protein